MSTRSNDIEMTAIGILRGQYDRGQFRQTAECEPCIMMPRKTLPTPPKTNSYSFKASTTAIDFEKIADEDLSYKEPVCIIESDDICTVMIHKSVARKIVKTPGLKSKLKIINNENLDALKHIFIETDKQTLSKIIEDVKTVKQAKWEHKPSTVTVTKVNI